jgi:hypothetical protein
MQTVDAILRSVIGRPFEFVCSDISIKGRLDYEEPVFRGSGTISGGVDGTIAFRLFDRSSASGLTLPRVLESINTQELLRLFATDSDGTEWSGGWFTPDVRFSDTGFSLVSGELSSISTRARLDFNPELAGSTALYYPENLPIEMQTATVTEIKRDGEIILQRRSVDHTKISDADFSIEIRENLTSGMTEVIAQNQPRLQPPFAEIGLSDAIVYLLCRVNRPRVVVRSSEKDALVIIRECNRNPRTGLPDAIRGHPERPKLCQTIFAAFLRQYLDW